MGEGNHKVQISKIKSHGDTMYIIVSVVNNATKLLH